jgi:predicted HicB family RNase H-like nuclease
MRDSRISVNVTPRLQTELRLQAAEEGRSVSNLVLQLIEMALPLRKRS